MSNPVHVFGKANMSSLDTQKAIKNILIAMALSLGYLLCKHFQTVQNSPADALTKINHVRTK